MPSGHDTTMKIMLVEDHAATRTEMRELVERQSDMTVVAEAATGEDAVVKARTEKPDVIVMDILLPGINGIEATRRIRMEQPGVRVLALSNHFGESLVQAVVNAGGLGYVRKSRAFEELVPALRAVSIGLTYVSQESTRERP